MKIVNWEKEAKRLARLRQRMHRSLELPEPIVKDIRRQLSRQEQLVAELHRAHEALRSTGVEMQAVREFAAESYRSLFDNAVEGIFQTSPQGRYLRANPALARIYGYASSEEMISSLTDVASQLYVDSNRREEFRSLMQSPGTVSNFESQVYRRDGSIIWISESARPVHDLAGALLYYEGFVEDITDRKELHEQQIRMLQQAIERADRDELTGLWNHRAFHKKWDEYIAESGAETPPFGVVLLDLDNFQFFNDVYGHAIGDEVLGRIAQQLRRICGVKDILARFGGDEFAVLLGNVGRATAVEIENRLRKALSGLTYKPSAQENPIPVGMSCGAAVWPKDGSDRLELLKRADERLRRVKSGWQDESEADRLRFNLRNALESYSMLDALVTAVDNKDRYTRRHSEDVMTHSLTIARSLGWDAETLHTLAVAALLHDVGKIGVPDATLRKPGKLSETEYEAVKQHPTMGAAIVSAVPDLQGTLDAVRYHHERWDGQGYPSGLTGEEIPPSARVMAVADAFSAMTTDRPYRQAMPLEKALSILRAGAGTQWEPACVEAFLCAHAESRRGQAARMAA